MVQEDPKHFFGDVADFFTPDAVGSRAVHVGNEAGELNAVFWFGVSKVG